MADWSDAQGSRHRRALGGTRADAEQALSAIIRERDLERSGVRVDVGLSMRLGDLARQYVADLSSRARPSSTRDARKCLERMERELGARTVRDINAPLVIAWRSKRVERGASNKTANTEVGHLKAALGYAVSLGQLSGHPLQGLRGLPVGARHQRRRPRALSDWELRRVFAAADELDPPGILPRAPLVRALALTGARWSELTSTTWADLDPELATLVLRAETTKNGHARVVPVDPSLLAELLALPARYATYLGRRPTPGSPIFLSPEGKSWSSGQRNFYRHLRNVFVRAGIPHKDEAGRVVHVHALRHTFATRLARAGVALATAMRLTGHRTTQILVGVYTHVGTEEARTALEALPHLHGGGKMPTSSGSAPASGAAADGRSGNADTG